jgi:predicted GIY-YIG superfamily endonuclease
MKTRYVYLIHFNEPYKHARHYLGSCDKLFARMQQHTRGTGARLLAVIKDAGISWQLVAVWKGDKKSERAARNRHDRQSLCPLCADARRQRKTASAQRITAAKRLAAINSQIPIGQNQQLFV